MKVLLNSSTLVMGGSIQVTVSFVREILRSTRGHDWVLALSKNVYEELEAFDPDWSTVQIFVIDPSPSKNPFSRKRLKALERKVQPDVVFTIFGPSYVNFNSIHVCGVGDGWVTHSNRLAFANLGGLIPVVLMIGVIAYKSLWFRKADHWVTEAENARDGLIRRLHLPEGQIDVVPNNCGTHYIDVVASQRFPQVGETVRLLCLSSYYKHKNLEIIPEVAREIQRLSPGLDFEFVLTLPPDGDDWKRISEKSRALDVEQHIVNEGPVPILNGPALYASCHIVFLPSLLETFSANYPEAMASCRPIVTTDLDFSHSICRDAAQYYEALNATSAAEAVLGLISSENRWDELTEAGQKRLQEFPNSRERADRYVAILEKVLETGQS